MFGKILRPQDGVAVNAEEMSEAMVNFDSWVMIYGSDEAVVAWQRLKQASFNDAPASLFVRLYSDFVLAARRDLGNPSTAVDRIELLAIKLNDAYTSSTLPSGLFSEDFETLAAQLKWPVPWLHGR